MRNAEPVKFEGITIVDLIMEQCAFHARIFDEGEEDYFMRALRTALEGNNFHLTVVGRYPAHLTGLFPDYTFLEAYIDCFLDVDFLYKFSSRALQIEILKNDFPTMVAKVGWMMQNDPFYTGFSCFLFNVLLRYSHFRFLRLSYKRLRNFKILQFDFGRVRFYLNIVNFDWKQGV